MINRKFKTFETIARFRKLYEADEMEQDVTADPAAEGGEAPADATDPNAGAAEGAAEGADGTDPNKQADPEAGVFMSDNQKAEIAKMLIDALMMTPPEPGTIPSNLINVTTDNADEVIKYIQGLNALSAPLSLDNDTDENAMGGALKSI
jgi:hypothetical protein